jgi:hypothetical protein
VAARPPSREDGAVKRATAIGHLVEMGEASSEHLRLRSTDIGWPVEELWVTGELLTTVDTLEAGSVVVGLDVPREELPWLAIHPAGEWAGSILRLGKRPMRWCYRSVAGPMWNHEHRRVARFWSADAGLDAGVIELLRTRQVDRLAVVSPTPTELRTLIEDELALSRRHLRTVLEQFWDHGWRRAHKGDEERPEDHLWRAAEAVSTMLDALDQLAGRRDGAQGATTPRSR